MLQIVLGVIAGAGIALQSSLNATLGKRVGQIGSVLILTFVSIAVLLVIIAVFPGTAQLRIAPGLSQWYLYLGGVLGVVILAAPIFIDSDHRHHDSRIGHDRRHDTCETLNCRRKQLHPKDCPPANYLPSVS